MKRLIIIICGIVLSLVAWGGVHSYVDHSVLREGKIIKICVSETGIHCLPYDTLKAWGLQPEKVRILGYGGSMLSENFTLAKWDDVPSVAFYMHKGADGVFGRGDYLLFYAQGPVKWAYEDGRWYHTQNPYSNFGYYFLSDSAGEQRLITQAEELDVTNAYDVDWYIDYRVHERDSFNLIDLSGVSVFFCYAVITLIKSLKTRHISVCFNTLQRVMHRILRTSALMERKVNKIF